MIFYFYKITNKINGKFYFGVHSTKNINDGYMGSGVALRRAYKKYGIENFEKEILYYFNNADEMYAFEEQYVNADLVNNPECYNMVIGGRSERTNKQLSLLAEPSHNTQEYRKKLKEGHYKYWTTGDVESKRKKKSESIVRYWTTGNVEEKKKRHAEAIKLSFENHPERRNKISEKLRIAYSGEQGEKIKKKISNSLKNSEAHKKASERFKETAKRGKENEEFILHWKKQYDENAEEICELLKHSNLPERFIVLDMYGKKVHMDRLLKYYQDIGLLSNEIKHENKARFLRFNDINGKGHKDGTSKKTFFSDEIKYNIMFYYEDFFQQFEIIKKFMMDDAVSDSMIFNNDENSKQVPNFNQIIEYFQELGVISNVHTILIRTPKTVLGRHFTVPAKKTKFDISYKGVNKILIDKEMNEYGIDDNGKTFRKGRFELEINGTKRPIRCQWKKCQNQELQSQDATE